MSDQRFIMQELTPEERAALGRTFGSKLKASIRRRYGESIAMQRDIMSGGKDEEAKKIAENLRAQEALQMQGAPWYEQALVSGLSSAAMAPMAIAGPGIAGKMGALLGGVAAAGPDPYFTHRIQDEEYWRSVGDAAVQGAIEALSFGIFKGVHALSPVWSAIAKGLGWVGGEIVEENLQNTSGKLFDPKKKTSEALKESAMEAPALSAMTAASTLMVPLGVGAIAGTKQQANEQAVANVLSAMQKKEAAVAALQAKLHAEYDAAKDKNDSLGMDAALLKQQVLAAAAKNESPFGPIRNPHPDLEKVANDPAYLPKIEAFAQRVKAKLMVDSGVHSAPLSPKWWDPDDIGHDSQGVSMVGTNDEASALVHRLMNEENAALQAGDGAAANIAKMKRMMVESARAGRSPRKFLQYPPALLEYLASDPDIVAFAENLQRNYVNAKGRRFGMNDNYGLRGERTQWLIDEWKDQAAKLNSEERLALLRLQGDQGFDLHKRARQRNLSKEDRSLVARLESAFDKMRTRREITAYNVGLGRYIPNDLKEGESLELPFFLPTTISPRKFQENVNNLHQKTVKLIIQPGVKAVSMPAVNFVDEPGVRHPYDGEHEILVGRKQKLVYVGTQDEGYGPIKVFEVHPFTPGVDPRPDRVIIGQNPMTAFSPGQQGAPATPPQQSAEVTASQIQQSPNARGNMPTIVLPDWIQKVEQPKMNVQAPVPSPSAFELKPPKPKVVAKKKKVDLDLSDLPTNVRQGLLDDAYKGNQNARLVQRIDDPLESKKATTLLMQAKNGSYYLAMALDQDALGFRRPPAPDKVPVFVANDDADAERIAKRAIAIGGMYRTLPDKLRPTMAEALNMAASDTPLGEIAGVAINKMLAEIPAVSERDIIDVDLHTGALERLELSTQVKLKKELIYKLYANQAHNNKRLILPITFSGNLYALHRPDSGAMSTAYFTANDDAEAQRIFVGYKTFRSFDGYINAELSFYGLRRSVLDENEMLSPDANMGIVDNKTTLAIPIRDVVLTMPDGFGGNKASIINAVTGERVSFLIDSPEKALAYARSAVDELDDAFPGKDPTWDDYKHMLVSLLPAKAKPYAVPSFTYANQHKQAASQPEGSADANFPPVSSLGPGAEPWMNSFLYAEDVQGMGVLPPDKQTGSRAPIETQPADTSTADVLSRLQGGNAKALREYAKKAATPRKLYEVEGPLVLSKDVAPDLQGAENAPPGTLQQWSDRQALLPGIGDVEGVLKDASTNGKYLQLETMSNEQLKSLRMQAKLLNAVRRRDRAALGTFSPSAYQKGHTLGNGIHAPRLVRNQQGKEVFAKKAAMHEIKSEQIAYEILDILGMPRMPVFYYEFDGAPAMIKPKFPDSVSELANIDYSIIDRKSAGNLICLDAFLKTRDRHEWNFSVDSNGVVIATDMDNMLDTGNQNWIYGVDQSELWRAYRKLFKHIDFSILHRIRDSAALISYRVLPLGTDPHWLSNRFSELERVIDDLENVAIGGKGSTIVSTDDFEEVMVGWDW